MPILDEKRLVSSGPYAYFLDLEAPLVVGEGDWPSFESYKEHIFFRFSDDLCDTVSSATRTYLPFDQFGLTQMTEPTGILKFSAEWLFRAHIMSITPAGCLADTLRYCNLSYMAGASPRDMQAAFQHDLLDTFLFLSDRLQKIAFSNRCLTIVGY